MVEVYEKIEEFRKDTSKYAGVLLHDDIMEIQMRDGSIVEEKLQKEISYNDFMREFAKVNNKLVIDMADLGDMKLIGIKETGTIIIRFKRDVELY